MYNHANHPCNIYHISTGDLLRRLSKSHETDIDIASSKLVADDIIYDIVSNEFISIPSNSLVCLDGFPRTVAQAKWLIGFLSSMHLKIDLVLHLDIVNQEVLHQRMVSRGRADDLDESTRRERLGIYTSVSEKIFEEFNLAGTEIVRINAESPQEEVLEDTLNKLLKIF